MLKTITTSNGVEGAIDCSAGLRKQGDCNSDGFIDIAVPVCVLNHLFVAGISTFPCGEDEAEAGMKVMDANGDTSLDISDGVFLLNFLFVSGNPPPRGTACFPVPNCSEVCAF